MAKNTDIPAQSYSAVAGLPTSLNASPRSGELLRSYRGWVYTAVGAIAEDVGAINLRLYKVIRPSKAEGTIEVKEVHTHHALSLLQYVNDFMSQPLLFEITTVYLKLLGEAYWAKLRDKDGEVIEIWPLRPDWVKIVPSKSNYIGGYIYQPPGVTADKAAKFDIQDIVPFKELNPADSYRGYSPTMAAAIAIDTDLYASDWNRNFFLNSAIPGLVFTSEKKLKKSTIDRFMKDWLSAFKGRGRSHKVAFLGGGMKLDKITDSKQEMDFREEKKDLRDEILAVYRVPKTVVGITEDVNKSSAEATTRAYMERTVTSNMLKITTHLNEFFLTDYQDQDNVQYFFDFDKPKPSNRELDLQIYENATKNFWMTPNEIRERENLPPLDGGDSVYIPSKVSADGEKSESLKLAVKSKEIKREFNVPLPQPSLRHLREKAVKEGFKHDLHRLISAVIRKGETGEVEKEYNSILSPDKVRQTHAEVVEVSEIHEQAWREELKKLFEQQEKRVLDRLDSVKYYAKKKRRGKEASFLFDLEDEFRAWKDIFAPKVLNVYSAQLIKTLKELGVEKEPLTTTDSARDYLEYEGLAFTLSVSQTTQEQLKQTLKEGLDSEEGIARLRERVRDVYAAAFDYRVSTIARTEVMRTLNHAMVEAYKQSEIVDAKEWVIHPDELACTECKSLDGMTIALGGSFGSGIGQAPPAHPSCRCIVAPAMLITSAGEEDKTILTDDFINKFVTRATERERANLKIDETLKDTAEVMKTLEKEKAEEIQRIKKEAEEVVASQQKQIQDKLKGIKSKIATIVAERTNKNDKEEK